MPRMSRLSGSILCLLACAATFVGETNCARADGANISITRLRCEYEDDPIGLGTTAPRLSWELRSKSRGAVQSGYEILVADSADALKGNHGSLWDSGKVLSTDTAQIAYAGVPLHTAERCWWKVRAWDGDGKDAGWSAPASFEIGLLQPGDWKDAQWIGVPAADSANSFAGAFWIWSAEAAHGADAPIGERVFERHIDIPADTKIAHARLALTADDQFRVNANGTQVAVGSTEFESWKRAQVIDLTAALKPGDNVIAITGVNTTVSPAGVLATLTVTFADGRPPLTIRSDHYWQVGGVAATEVAPYGEGPWGKNVAFGTSGNDGGPGRYLRHKFTLSRPIVAARLYATALGIYEPFINGQRVGNDVFAPGWTDYHKRVQYETYDVTSMLKDGDNAVGLVLSDGWYAGHIGLASRGVYGTDPAARALLRVEYADGSADTIVTDSSWRGSTAGPVVAADLQSGEAYDARKEMGDWSAARFDDASVAWQPARALADSPTISLDAQRGPSVRRTQELAARSVRQSLPGHYLFDLGQNMVGWARLKVSGPAGATVTLRFAEMLNADGTIYTTNYRGARCVDEYTLRGDRKGETFDPEFTFRGFRYVEVTGWPGSKAPDVSAITGVVAGSDTPRTGVMSTSSKMVNQLLSNIDWGQRGNFLSVPTDCPQRDERLGWMGDAQIFVRTATYNRDVAGFFDKWMVDVDDAQTAQGAFSDVSPRVNSVGAGTAAWGDAGVICPWTIYLAYGDKRILQDCYPSMQRWVAFCQEHSAGLIRPASGYGDWLSIAADTPKDVLATAYFAYSTHLTAESARALGKTDDAAKYDALFDQIKAAFDTAFVTADGHIKGNTQTDYVLALRFNLLPDSVRPAASNYLAADVHAKGDHLSTGFVGVGYLCPTLTATGHDDVAYDLLNQTTFPSWGYSISYGATTIWERWDGWTADKGFQTPSMNSFNHYSLGSVGQWLYDSVAGITPDAADPGYHHILLRPQPGGGLTHAEADFDSIHGRITSHWAIDGDHINYEIAIPANTSATVWLPATDASQVTEGGKPVAGTEGVRFVRADGGFAMYEVGAGSYRFSAPNPAPHGIAPKPPAAL